MNRNPELPRAVSELFGGGERLRELRLGEDEAELLRACGAQVRELAPAGDKRWYAVSFEEVPHEP